MHRILTSTAALALTAGIATAGGVERSVFSSSFLFEEGSYAELSFGIGDPSVSGVLATGLGPLASGDMASGFQTYSLAYKRDLNDKWTLGIVLDQPIGADVAYPVSAAPYPFAGAGADLNSFAVTGIAKYQATDAVSVYGGLRFQQVSGTVSGVPVTSPPAPGTPFDLDAANSTEIGYVIGVAWEKPEIAARVALTYESERTHTFDTQETFGAIGPIPGTMDTTIPQAVTLEFQTGVAEDTLVFGSVRWVEWTAFDITPPNLGAALVSYADDRTTYTLGVGRRFNETWSGAVSISHEETTSSPVGNLGPTNGFSSVGLGATYTMDNMKISGGVRYVDLGDATTTTIGSRFTDNSAIVGGIRIGFSF
ncbi:MAG: outer membrane protein transport protein [Paracoccaceae bacterium]|nr:outer membrane protein transport protein [Paracoccaceae bacterium]